MAAVLQSTDRSVHNRVTAGQPGNPHTLDIARAARATPLGLGIWEGLPNRESLLRSEAISSSLSTMSVVFWIVIAPNERCRQQSGKAVSRVGKFGLEGSCCAKTRKSKIVMRGWSLNVTHDHATDTYFTLLTRIARFTPTTGNLQSTS